MQEVDGCDLYIADGRLWERYCDGYYGDLLRNVTDQYIVMQDTGLKDNENKGEALYHKDIVWVTKYYMGDSFCPAQIGVIEWVDDGWTVVNKDGDYLCELWDYTYNYCGGKRGTIHSNPELLNA